MNESVAHLILEKLNSIESRLDAIAPQKSKIQWLVTAEATEFLGVSEDFLNKMARKNRLKQKTHYRYCGGGPSRPRRQWNVEAIAQWMNRHPACR